MLESMPGTAHSRESQMYAPTACKGPTAARCSNQGSTVRWQPITPNLATCLVDHAAARGAVLPTDPVLRYSTGRALTTRPYDHLWNRLGERLPWVATQGISTLVCRVA
jgi:hypothetical protein